MAQFKKVAIIGVGLIGGSIGLAIKKKKLADEVKECENFVEFITMSSTSLFFSGKHLFKMHIAFCIFIIIDF